MMWYLVVFCSALVVDLIPVFAPPAWMFMVFFMLKFHLNPWAVLVAGVVGSSIGRYLFSLYVPKIADRLIKRHKQEELEFTGMKLSAGRAGGAAAGMGASSRPASRAAVVDAGSAPRPRRQRNSRLV